MNAFACFARRRLPGLSGALLMATLATQALAANSPGVSAAEIVIGGVMPLSGPVRLVSEPYEQGIRAHFNEVNQSGGVNGRKINYVVEDDAYQPSKALAAAKKLIERDNVFMLFGQFGVPQANAMIPYVEQARVPLMIVTSVPPPNKKYAFGFLANYSDVTYFLTKYYVQQLKAKRVGYFYQNDDLGEVGRVGVNRALKELGIELAADVGFERGTSDFSTHALKLRDANVEAVVTMTTAPALASVIKASLALPFKPVWGTYSIGSSNALINVLGADIAGLVYASELESQFAEAPGVQAHIKALKASYPNATAEWGTLLGYAHARFAVAALKAAGKDPTRESLAEALRQARNVEVSTMANTGYLPDDTMSAVRALRIFRWENGKPQPQTDWLPVTPPAK